MQKLDKVVRKVEWSDYYNLTDKFAWDEISMRSNLSEEFIEEFADKLNWTNISIFSTLSIDFMKRHINDLNWKQISYNQNIKLTDEFILLFVEKLDWKNIYQYALGKRIQIV